MGRGMVGLAAAVGLAAFGLSGCGLKDEHKASPGAEGVSVAEVRFPELERALEAQKGKVVLVDFWATWCGPCVKRFPHLVGLHKEYAERGLACMSVSIDRNGPKPGSNEQVLEFLKSKGATFQNFLLTDPRADMPQIASRFGAFSSIPYMVLFDRSGKKVWDSHTRPMSPDLFEDYLRSLLNDTPSPVVAAGSPIPPEVATTEATPTAINPDAIRVTEVRFPALDKAITDQKGKVVVVDFWATWCKPCVKKFPHLVEMHRKLAAKGLVCVSVSMDKAGPVPGTPEEILAFLRKEGAEFPNFILGEPEADEKPLAGRFGEFAGIPYMVVFDRTGKKIWDSDTRSLKPEEVAHLIEEELAKK